MRRARKVVAATVVAAVVLLLPAVAPATIQEQRARLPPPAFCDDPVTGVWRSHSYSPAWGDWTVFMLTIERVPGSETELTGSIVNHSWDAGPTVEEPPSCGREPQWIVSMDARGRSGPGQHIFFGGVGAWRLDRVLCARGPGAYNLDNFSGEIEPEIQEFQSVNNDGGRAVNEPTVFRRVNCTPSPPSPHVQPIPPPFYPDRGSGGCSL